jgi:hypothetical protein
LITINLNSASVNWPLGSQTEAIKYSLDRDCENHPEAEVVETNSNIPNLENENLQKQIFEMKKKIGTMTMLSVGKTTR